MSPGYHQLSMKASSNFKNAYSAELAIFTIMFHSYRFTWNVEIHISQSYIVYKKRAEVFHEVMRYKSSGAAMSKAQGEQP